MADRQVRGGVSTEQYSTVREAQQGLGHYFGFYNDERLHQALGYRQHPQPSTVGWGSAVHKTA